MLTRDSDVLSDLLSVAASAEEKVKNICKKYRFISISIDTDVDIQ